VRTLAGRFLSIYTYISRGCICMTLRAAVAVLIHWWLVFLRHAVLVDANVSFVARPVVQTNCVDAVADLT